MRRKRPLKITSRVSSVTNGFVQAILPDIEPCEIEQAEVLAILAIDPEKPSCAYCGDPSRHWDHLRPLVKNKRPSGSFNEARNRVPACDSCNTSKSGHDWRNWIKGPARNSPMSRGIADLHERIERLERLESALAPSKLPFEALVGEDLWHEYWRRRDEIEALMFEAQVLAEQIRCKVQASLQSGPENEEPPPQG